MFVSHRRASLRDAIGTEAASSDERNARHWQTPLALRAKSPAHLLLALRYTFSVSPPVPTNCHACKYSLAGIDRPTCPECGADITPVGFAVAEGRASRRGTNRALVLLAIGVLCSGVIAYPSNPPPFYIGAMAVGWASSTAFLTAGLTHFLRKGGMWIPAVPSFFIALIAPFPLTFAWLIVFRLIDRMQ